MTKRKEVETEEVPDKALNFNSHFLNQIVYHSIQSTEFIQKVRGIFPLGCFKTQERKFIMEMIYDHFDQYKTAPMDNFYDIFKDNESVMDSSLYEKCIILIDFLKDITGSNPEYILSKIEQAVMHLQLEEASIEFASLIKRKKYEDAKSVILKAMRPPEGVTPDYFDYFQDKEYIKDRIMGESYKMKTMIKGLDAIIGGVNPPWLVTLLGATKSGKCVKYDSPIILSDGSIKTIEEIVKNEISNIITYNEDTGRLVKGEATEFYDNGIKPCYKVVTKTGREQETTLNHPYLTVNGWKPLSSIGVGQSIAVPKKIDFFGNLEIEKERIRLLAYLIADGGLTKDHCVSFTKHSETMMHDFCNCVSSVGDVFSFCKDKPYCGYITNNNKRSNSLIWLDDLGLSGTKSEEKFIPEDVFKLNKECLSEFLSTLFSCDGHICKSGSKFEIGYSSASETLVKQVSILLTRFGVVSKFKKKINKDGYESYNLTINDKQNILLFLEEIGFIFEKGEKAKEHKKQIEKLPDNRSFVSSLPCEFIDVIQEELISYIEKTGKKDRKWWSNGVIRNFRQAKTRGTGISLDTVKKIAELLNSEKLNSLVNSDIFFDEIISIEYIGDFQTYDIGVPKTYNFIGNNVIVHNTWHLIEFAVAAVLQGLNVTYFSLEMNKKQSVARFDQVVGFLSSKSSKEQQEVMVNIGDKWGMSKQKVKSIYDLKEVERNKKAVRRASQGGLKIIASNKGRFNDRDIERVLNQLEQEEGYITDVLVVDYLGIMKKTEEGQNKKQTISENCLGLVEICGTRNMICFTAMQGNRQAMRAKVFQSWMIADDIDTVFWSDLILAICQTKNEEKQNKARLHVANFRHGKQFGSVGLIRDLTIGQIALGEYELKEEGEEEENQNVEGADGW